MHVCVNMEVLLMFVLCIMLQHILKALDLELLVSYTIANSSVHCVA